MPHANAWRTGTMLAVALTLATLPGCTPGLAPAGAGCAICDVLGGKSAAPSARASASSQAVDAVALAASLSDHGYRTSSPLALLSAAELVLDTPPSALSVPREQSGGAAPAPSAKTRRQVTLDAGQLIAAARTMASNNSTVIALANQLQQRASGPKGAARGPQFAHSEVLAGSRDIYRIQFRGGERASVRIDGDGDTDLDCYVYNSSGALVAADVDFTDICFLDWWPSSTSTHRIEIVNLGSVYNVYTLVTN